MPKKGVGEFEGQSVSSVNRFSSAMWLANTGSSNCWLA